MNTLSRFIDPESFDLLAEFGGTAVTGLRNAFTNLVPDQFGRNLPIE